MSAFFDKLETVRRETRGRFRQILEEHVGEISVMRYDRESWSSFIGCAVLSGLTIAEISEGTGVDEAFIAGWLDGCLAENTHQRQHVLEFITKSILESESV